MAGTIAQVTDNHLGAAGIAPDAAIMPIRVLSPDGSGTSAAISQGLRFAADHGANVANLSLGGEVGTRELQDAVAYATGKGVTVVVSAGDEGAPAVNFPAAFPGAIAVGAVRFDNTRAAYSDYGPRLDLVAPGGDLHVDQNGDGLDDGIVQQTLQGSPSNFCFCFKEGTSSAAAHVSGVAALVVASGRATTPSEVRRVLTETATDLGPPGRDDEYGAGLVQAAAALGIGTGVGTPSGTTTVRTSRSRPTSRASGTGPATAAVGCTHRRGPAHLFTSTHVPATPPEASHRLAARHAFVVVRRRARPTPRPHGPGGRSTVPNYLGRG
jgi:serine protease